MNNYTEKHVEDLVDMLQTLNDSIIAAGGTPFTIEKLKRMTAWELVTHLSPNRVRFVLLPRKVEESPVVAGGGCREKCRWCKRELTRHHTGSYYCSNNNCL